MEKLAIEDLKEGEFYVTAEPTPGYIFQAKGDCTCVTWIKNTSFSRTGHLSSIGNTAFKYYRPATSDEIAHWHMCNEADRYVQFNKPTVNNAYEIF